MHCSDSCGLTSLHGDCAVRGAGELHVGPWHLHGRHARDALLWLLRPNVAPRRLCREGSCTWAPRTFTAGMQRCIALTPVAWRHSTETPSSMQGGVHGGCQSRHGRHAGMHCSDSCGLTSLHGDCAVRGAGLHVGPSSLHSRHAGMHCSDSCGLTSLHGDCAVRGTGLHVGPRHLHGRHARDARDALLWLLQLDRVRVRVRVRERTLTVFHYFGKVYSLFCTNCHFLY